MPSCVEICWFWLSPVIRFPAAEGIDLVGALRKDLLDSCSLDDEVGKCTCFTGSSTSAFFFFSSALASAVLFFRLGLVGLDAQRA